MRFSKISLKTMMLSVVSAAAFLTAPFGSVLHAATFVTAMTSKPETLDPAGTYERYGNMIELAIYEPLIAFAGDTSRAGFTPVLSEKVPAKENGLLSADGRTYIFPIRRGIKFHDGSELKAADAAYSLIRFMITDSPSGPANLFLKPLLGVSSVRDDNGAFTISFRDLAAAVKADGDRLIIKLKEPYPPFLSLLASRPFITSRAWAAAHGEWSGGESDWREFAGVPIKRSHIRYLADGTGPFKLESVDRITGRILLVRNPAYWRGPARLDKLVFATVESESARLAMMDAGDIDYGEFSRPCVAQLCDMKDVQVREGRSSQALMTLAFNYKIDRVGNPFTGSGVLDGKGIPADFFTDSDVRKGFAFAMNYGALLTSAWYSKAARITSPVPRPGAPAVPAFTFDKVKAEKYFRNAFSGELWKNGFALVFPYPINNPKAREAGRILAESLKAINPRFIVDLLPERVDLVRAQERRRQTPLVWIGFEPDYPAQYNYAFAMMHSDGVLPKTIGYANPEADKLCENVLLGDRAAREKALSALDKIYAEDAPYLLLFAGNNFMVYRKGVTGTETGNWLYTANNLPDFYQLKKP